MVPEALWREQNIFHDRVIEHLASDDFQRATGRIKLRSIRLREIDLQRA
jgi:hypothetical protein